MDVRKDNTCIYSNAAMETIMHAVIKCPYAFNLRKQVAFWINDLTETNLEIGEISKSFGQNAEDKIIDGW